MTIYEKVVDYLFENHGITLEYNSVNDTYQTRELPQSLCNRIGKGLQQFKEELDNKEFEVSRYDVKSGNMCTAVLEFKFKQRGKSMSVKDILEVIPRGTVVNIKQVSIKELGGDGESPVSRQQGEVGCLLSSNQNYLQFDVVSLYQNCGLLTVLCKANKKQEESIIRGQYEVKL